MNISRQKNLISQWAFDTRPILGRFHLWLENVEIEWLKGKVNNDELTGSISFVGDRIERMLAMTAAVTSLGTRLFGRYGEGAGLSKNDLNFVKKDADAISAYSMSEGLWYLSRSLPENHAIMICLGEGLMPKAGESPEMGANPLLGFGRVYARPQVAKFLDECVLKLINDSDYTWEIFRKILIQKGIVVWGAAIDTLENTSRFAKGEKTGPMTVLHLFDQPLCITNQYEGYMGCLILPNKVVEIAELDSLLINYFTPRHMVVKAIQKAYPGIKPEHIHVWTLTGKTRTSRIGNLWQQWKETGAHLVDNTWTLPSGFNPFTDSGTYAPTYAVNSWIDDNGNSNLFLVDGYAASAEAIQAASLAPVLNLNASLAVLSSDFLTSYDRDAAVMKLNPDTESFSANFAKECFDTKMDAADLADVYKESILLARNAGIPLQKRTITVDDLISEKTWNTLAIAGYMLDDPYTGAHGVTLIDKDTYKTSIRMATDKGEKLITLTLRLLKPFETSKLIFSPLLNRFLKGEDFMNRAVKVSDSGRIRNELQTLCVEALEYVGHKIILNFNNIPKATISKEDQEILKKILTWYKANYPVWFEWLELN